MQLLSIATIVHGTNHMYNHLRTNKQKSQAKQPTTRRQKKPSSKSKTKPCSGNWALVLLPSKELYGLEGHYRVQSVWIFLEERKNSFCTKRITFLHSMYLLLQNNKDHCWDPASPRKLTTRAQFFPLPSHSLRIQLLKQELKLHNTTFKSSIWQQKYALQIREVNNHQNCFSKIELGVT